jgi:hypothetical protein
MAVNSNDLPDILANGTFHLGWKYECVSVDLRCIAPIRQYAANLLRHVVTAPGSREMPILYLCASDAPLPVECVLAIAHYIG